MIELLAAVVFLSKGAFFSAVMASVCYAWVLGSTAGVTTDTVLSWSIYTVIFAIVGLVGGYLSEELKRTSDRLKQKNQEIQQLTQLFEGIIEGMPTGLLTLDEEMNIAFLNPGAETILNKKRAQLVGRSLKNEVPDLLPFFEALSAEKIEDESDELVQSGIETELTSTGTEWHRSVFLKAMLGKGETNCRIR
ncbi:PAS domain-containing protein [bacterium]|nr:PAS domain-containing protein [bacterium]